ncbi:MAG: hypothetical protein IJS32_08805 [Kiritimatiellae bacterium]|nr:hypothetical protein [Kiritimatiellia bacterium]
MHPVHRPAAILVLSAFVLSARAVPVPPSATRPDDRPSAPAIVARAEVRGIAPLIDMAERIAGAESLPPGQLRDMVSAMVGLDPVALLGEGPEPLRSIIYAVPGVGEPGLLLDVPAADGDLPAFFAKLAGIRWAEQPIPEKHAAKLPGGSHLFRAPGAGSDPLVLAIPHGARVALLPLAQRGGLRPAQVPEVLAAATPIASEGTVAFAADMDALVPLLPQDGNGDALAAASGIPPLPGLPDIFGSLPVRELEFAFGLDGADCLRIAYAATPREGTLEARLASGIGAPAPLANAIFFPDALLAIAQRAPLAAASEADWLASWRHHLSWNPLWAEADSDARAFVDRFASLCAKQAAAFARLAPSGASFALFPANGAKRCPWAFCAPHPDAAAFLDSLPGLVKDAFSDNFLDLAKTAAASDDDFDAEGFAKAEALDFRIEPAGKRKIRDTEVRRFAVRFTDSDGRDWTLASFDALSAGGMLLVANLDEPVLADIAADLARGETVRAPLAELPAFRHAYGAPPPPDAATAVVRLVPAVQTVCRAFKARIGELEAGQKALDDAEGKTEEDGGEGDDGSFPAGATALLEADDLPDCAIAATQRYNPETGRSECTVAIRFAELRALHDRLSPLFAGGGEDADGDEDGEEDGDDLFSDW